MRPLAISLLITSALLASSSASAQRVYIVWDGTYDDGDGVSVSTNARRHALERLGFPVGFLNPNTSESWLDTYGPTSLYDVLYVCGDADTDALADKLRDHQTAIVYETPEMDDAFGLSSSDGSSAGGTQILIDTIGHPVTSTVFLGNANLYTSANPISVMHGTPATSLQALASQGGQTCLAVVDTGGTLANTIDGNSVAANRRVRLPFGSDGTNWSEVTGSTINLLEQSVLWATAADYAPTASLGICVMVTNDNGSLNDEETWRVRRLTYCGWAVVLLWDGDSKANYDSAIAAADVVYVTTEADSAEVGDKLRTATCGVVYENNELDDNLGLATGGGVRTASSGFYTRDREHPVTANMYLDEYVSCFYTFDYAGGGHAGMNQELGRMSGTLAPDLRVLGTRWSEPVLATVDTGDELANNVGGNTHSSGRRVRLPWVGDADLTTLPSWAEGSDVWEAALRWASGTQTGSLVAHYKLDEASGTTAADSSGNGYDGEYRGGVTQNITPAPRSIAANFDATGEHVYAPANTDFANLAADNGDFSVAFWIRPHAVTHSEWRNILHIGGASSSDRGPLIMLEPTLRRFYCWVSTTTIATGTGGYSSFEVDNDEWVHVTVVKSGSFMRWYLDGEFVNTHNVTGESVATQGDLRIGEETWWGRPDADLDDVRVYSYALADQEIRELHADLVLHYKLEETAGTTAEDSSIFLNTGTINGSPPLGEEGAVGEATQFSTNDDSVSRSNTASLEALGQSETDYTFAMWVKPHGLTGTHRTLFHKGDSDASRSPAAFIIPSDNRITISIDTTAAANEFRSSLGQLVDERWNHVAFTKEGRVVSFYIDGVFDSSWTLSGDSVGNAGSLYLGDSPWREPANATIDDFRIYNRALSGTEVFELGGSGLRLHMKFDETSGNVAEDSSPFKWNATVATGAPTWQEGIVNNAARFDGVSDVFATDEPFDPPSTGAVAFWMKRTARPTTTDRLFGSGGNWEVRQVADGTIAFDLGFSQYVGTTDLQTLEPVGDDGRWHHVVANFNADDDTYEIYLDGKLHRSETLPYDMIAQPVGVLSIGDRTGAGEPYNGDLDDLRVYDRELTSEEVAELYGLIGHWRLDEIAGDTVAVDETVFAQDGIYHDTPTLEEESPYPSDAVRTAATFEPGDYVQVPAAEHLEVGTDNADFSVAYWLRNNRENSGQWRETFKKHTSGRERTFAMWLRPDDERMHCRVSTHHSWNEGTDTVTEFTPGVWHHVAYVKRGSQLLIYVDGILDVTDNLDGAVYGNNGSIYFGVRSVAWRSDVSIDDVRLYSRALNDWEVAELHGLVGWYRMEDLSGSVATDSSGMKNHGVVYGNTPSWPLDAQEGTASIELDGSNYIETSDLPVRGPGAAISGWAKLTDADISGSEVVSLGDHLALRLDSPGTPGVRAFGYNGGSWEFADSGRFVEGAGWHHIAASYRDDLREISLFIDGVLVSIEPLSADLDLSSLFSTVTIGNHGTSKPNYQFTGQLDDIRVYNRPISRAEARALYYGEGVPGLRIVNWVEVPNP